MNNNYNLCNTCFHYNKENWFCNKFKHTIDPEGYCHAYETTITLEKIENVLRELTHGREPLIDYIIQLVGSKERAMKVIEELDIAIIKQLKNDKYKENKKDT